MSAVPPFAPEPVPAAPGASQEAEGLRAVAGFLDELGNRRRFPRLEDSLERDLGLGSIERVQLVDRLERTFGRRLPERAMFEVETVGALFQALSVPTEVAVPDRWRPSPQVAPGGSSVQQQRACGLTTLTEVAAYWAETDPDRKHVRLLQDDGKTRDLSFGDLWRRARHIGGAIAARGVGHGDRVVLILPTSEDFFLAFLAIYAAGAVPVPLYPPIRMSDLAAYCGRQRELLNNAAPRLLVTDRQLAPAARLLADQTEGLPGVVTVSQLEGEGSPAAIKSRPDDLGLIQYTSGSTGNPKGVALTHRALLANGQAAGKGLAYGPEDVMVSWLPLYHDMGLIGAWLTSYLHGMPVVVLSPLQFLSRPERWLWAFHHFRGSITASPNFGYELCLRKVDEQAITGLDLSTLRCALNGSEPVRRSTVDRFCARYAAHNFARSAMIPVYGLAETAVALTFPRLGRGPKVDRISRSRLQETGRCVEASEDADAIEVLACGVPLSGYQVRIVEAADKLGKTLPGRCEGRVQFRGPSSMSGYFRRPDADAEVWVGDWIDTGDLGYLSEGELFITGRIKELVIKGGRKFHPHDIEQAAETVEGVRKGRVIAFAVPAVAGSEAIVVVAETGLRPENRERMTQQMLRAVDERVGIPPDRVELIQLGVLPRTSSGKLKRGEARRLYMEGRLRKTRTGIGAWLRLGLQAVSGRARRATRTMATGAYGYYAVGSALLTLVPGALMTWSLLRGRKTTWSALRLSLAAWGRVTGLGPRREGVPLPEQSAILVSNHASNLDPLLLMAALERPVVFTAKAGMFKTPVLRTLMRRLRHVPIERDTAASRLKSLDTIREAGERRELVHFFPEATITPEAGLRPFRLGAFVLAGELGLPIVPVAIAGSRKAWRDGQPRPRPSDIRVHVLPAIPVPRGADLNHLSRLRDSVRAELARLAGEPMLDVVSAALPEGTDSDDGERR